MTYRTLAGGAALLAAALGLFALLLRPSDPSRPQDAPPGEESESEPIIERTRASRTRALEQRADRCAPEIWQRADEQQEAASRAWQEGDVVRARELYAGARGLYDEAAARASTLLVRGACVRDDGPDLRARPAPSAPSADPLQAPRERESPPGSASEPGLAVVPPPVSDEDELELRSRATTLVTQGQACEAVELLQREGRSERSRRLARALVPSCRRPGPAPPSGRAQ